MEDVNSKSDSRIWLGAILIVLGFLFFLNSLDILDFSISRIVFSWPFFFILIGVFTIINTKKKLLGGILSGLGAIFIVPRIFPSVDYDGTIVFAIIFIALGLFIIFNRTGKEKEKVIIDEQRKDYIDDIAIFGGGEKVISSENFRGGNITAIFGGSEIDLTNCSLAEGINVIDVLCIFGGTSLIVPKDWNVIVNITPIFGGFSNKSFKAPNPSINKSKTLIIKGLAVFGGGEIKSY